MPRATHGCSKLQSPRRWAALARAGVAALSARRALPVAGGPWQFLGPAPEGTAPWIANTGRNLVLTWDAALNGGTLFAGTADGGIWSSTFPFTSWSTHTDAMPSLAVGAITVDPSDPTGMTLFAGTGEQSLALDSLYGAGVYKTVNGGSTWTAIGPSAMGLDTISSIVIDSSGTIFASVTGMGTGVWISTDHGAVWSNSTNLSAVGVSDLALDSAGDVYAAAGEPYSSESNGGLWECLAPCGHDGAFTLIGGGETGAGSFPASDKTANVKLSVAALSGGPPTREAVFVIAGDASDSNHILGVYRAEGTGSSFPATPPSWTRIADSSTPAVYEMQAWYDLYISVDPSDPTGNTVYFGLSDIYRSTDALATAPSWTNLTNVYSGSASNVHPDQHGFASNGSGTTFFGNDGGVWESTDGGNTFTDINGNLGTLQFYGGDLGTNRAEGCRSNCDANLRIGGMQDNGVAETDLGAIDWNQYPADEFGDGGYVLVDPKNNDIRYSENTLGDVAVMTDGATFHDAQPSHCGASDWMAPLAYDPKRPSTLLVGLRSLCVSTNVTAAQPTWHSLSSHLLRTPVAAIAISYAGRKRAIYISDSSGHTYYTTNNGAKWTSMDTGRCPGPLCTVGRTALAGPTSTWNGVPEVSALAADPTRPGVLYATVNGYEGHSAGHIFKWISRSLKGSGKWSDISGQLPDEPYSSITLNPIDPNTLYVGGTTGAFITSAGPAGWHVLGTGLPNAEVDQLRVSRNGKIVVAFTHGRSAWQIAVSTP